MHWLAAFPPRGKKNILIRHSHGVWLYLGYYCGYIRSGSQFYTKHRCNLLTRHSFAFLGSLIYGSVIFHRYRRNKRKGLNAQNITQNPYYHGPYGENGISNANYTPVQSTYPPSAVGGAASVYGSEGVHSPYVENTAPAPAYVAGELAEPDKNSDVKHMANELSATPEVYELFSPANTHTQGQGNRW